MLQPSFVSLVCLEVDRPTLSPGWRTMGWVSERRSQTTCADLVHRNAMAGRTWMALLVGTAAWKGARGGPYDEPGPCRYRREKMDVDTTAWCVECKNHEKHRRNVETDQTNRERERTKRNGC